MFLQRLYLTFYKKVHFIYRLPNVGYILTLSVRNPPVLNTFMTTDNWLCFLVKIFHHIVSELSWVRKCFLSLWILCSTYLSSLLKLYYLLSFFLGSYSRHTFTFMICASPQPFSHCLSFVTSLLSGTKITLWMYCKCHKCVWKRLLIL